MKKLVIAAMACAMPLTASAKGWGFTHHSATSYSGSSANAIQYGSQFHDLPSLDIRQAGWVIQLDVLDLLHGFATETVDADGDDARDIHFGINAYKTIQKHPIREDGLGGVMQPGSHFETRIFLKEAMTPSFSESLGQVFSKMSMARRSSAEHPIATKALRCTATAWIPHCR